ncbi:MAG: STAS domain-containing protein [Rhodocyclaceae bacterium]|nr:STAS domain-containing protein [Rhodocyclaceae bacterium]
MDIEISTVSGQASMRLSGRFDYTTRNQFMSEADRILAQAEAPEIRIDMGNLEYIDSSALGMLLMLRDKAKKHDKTIALHNARGYVRQVIDTAQFERLFTVA